MTIDPDPESLAAGACLEVWTGMALATAVVAVVAATLPPILRPPSAPAPVAQVAPVAPVDAAGADLASILSTPAPVPQPEGDPAVIHVGRGGSLTLRGGATLVVPSDRGGEVVLIGGPDLDLDLGAPPENTSAPGYMLVDVRLFSDLYVTADVFNGPRTWVGHAHGGVAWCSSASCAPVDGGR